MLVEAWGVLCAVVWGDAVWWKVCNKACVVEKCVSGVCGGG